MSMWREEEEEEEEEEEDDEGYDAPKSDAELSAAEKRARRAERFAKK